MNKILSLLTLVLVLSFSLTAQAAKPIIGGRLVENNGYLQIFRPTISLDGELTGALVADEYTSKYVCKILGKNFVDHEGSEEGYYRTAYYYDKNGILRQKNSYGVITLTLLVCK